MNSEFMHFFWTWDENKVILWDLATFNAVHRIMIFLKLRDQKAQGIVIRLLKLLIQYLSCNFHQVIPTM